MNAYKADVLLLLLSSLVTHKLLAIQHIDIATEQSFGYMKLTDTKNLEFQKCVIMQGFRKSRHI